MRREAAGWTRFGGQVDQERRFLDVRAVGIPREQFAGRDRQGVPGGVGLEDIVVPARNISGPMASATTRPTSSRDGQMSFK